MTDTSTACAREAAAELLWAALLNPDRELSPMVRAVLKANPELEEYFRLMRRARATLDVKCSFPPEIKAMGVSIFAHDKDGALACASAVVPLRWTAFKMADIPKMAEFKVHTVLRVEVTDADTGARGEVPALVSL